VTKVRTLWCEESEIFGWWEESGVCGERKVRYFGSWEKSVLCGVCEESVILGGVGRN